jgi:hypothetical protein
MDFSDNDLEEENPIPDLFYKSGPPWRCHRD